MTWDITGMGAVASIGRDPSSILDAWYAGRSGRARLRAFEADRFRVGYAYEIDDRTEPGRDEPLRATRWLCAAVAQALADAGLDGDRHDYPVLVGTTLREQRSVELWWRQGGRFDLTDLNFGRALRSTSGYTFANSCAASLCTLAMATDLIALDLADTVVVAGTDSMTESAFGMFDKLQKDLPDALQPFDKGRRGMLMGEGAAAVVIQRPQSARLAHARLLGVSMNCDAHHPTAPDPGSIARAIRQAHERANLGPADIDLVMLHGTGTRLNDQAEAAALAEVFGANTTAPLMTALKSATGHTLGGSGLASLVMAVLAMKRGKVPAIIGLNDPIDEVTGLRLVVGASAKADMRIAQVNAFGLGGVNAVAVVEQVP